MRYKYRFILPLFCAFTAILLCAGCGKKDIPDPPTSRTELTGRLFESLKRKNHDEALLIIDKLLALEPDDIELMEMRDRVIANRCTAQVQKAVDQGKLAKALQIVKQERRKNPMIPQLRVLEDEVNDLQNLQASAKQLANAKTLPELSAALNQIAPLAAKYPQAKQLQQDIKKRTAELAAMRKRAAEKETQAVQNAAPATKTPDKSAQAGQ